MKQIIFILSILIPLLGYCQNRGLENPISRDSVEMDSLGLVRFNNELFSGYVKDTIAEKFSYYISYFEGLLEKTSLVTFWENSTIIQSKIEIHPGLTPSLYTYYMDGTKKEELLTKNEHFDKTKTETIIGRNVYFLGTCQNYFRSLSYNYKMQEIQANHNTLDNYKLNEGSISKWLNLYNYLNEGISGAYKSWYEDGSLMAKINFEGMVIKDIFWWNRNGELLSDTILDNRNGLVYYTININGRIWMAQNLNFRTDFSYCFDNLEINCDRFGRIYKFDYKINSICPKGWHIPTRQEWDDLVSYFSGVNWGSSFIESNDLLMFGKSGLNINLAGYFEQNLQDKQADNFKDFSFQTRFWMTKNDLKNLIMDEFINGHHDLSAFSIEDYFATIIFFNINKGWTTRFSSEANNNSIFGNYCRCVKD